MLDERPLDTRFILGDTAYQSADRHDAVFHALRHVAAENRNALVKDLFDLHGTVPTTGFLATQCYVLGCIFVDQVAVWYRAEQSLPLNVGMKAFLRAA